MGATAGVSDLGRVEASPWIKRGRAPAGPAVSPLTFPSRREPVPPRLSHFFLWAGSATPSSPPVKITGKRLVTPEPKLRRFLVTAAHAENAAATRYNPGPITMGPGVTGRPEQKARASLRRKARTTRKVAPVGRRLENVSDNRLLRAEHAALFCTRRRTRPTATVLGVRSWSRWSM